MNRFPSLGSLKSPLESMGHTPVRLSVYKPARLLPLQQDAGYSYSHPAVATSDEATLSLRTLTPEVMRLTPCSSGGRKKKKERSAIRELGTEVCFEVVRKWATRKDACIRVRKARARRCLLDRQPSCRTDPPAASVADKLHGLAGTSGAQVALSIQDWAH